MFGVRWCDLDRDVGDPEHLPYQTFRTMRAAADAALREAAKNG
jgi:hypothetical protein